MKMMNMMTREMIEMAVRVDGEMWTVERDLLENDYEFAGTELPRCEALGLGAEDVVIINGDYAVNLDEFHALEDALQEADVLAELEDGYRLVECCGERFVFGYDCGYFTLYVAKTLVSAE